MAAQTQVTLQVQQKMQAQFQQYQESQQVILEGIRQQREAQRQQMLQHQMLTSQMFTFMSGCLSLASSSSSQDFSYLSHLPLPSYRLIRLHLFLQRVSS
jgi:hypothetical protein